MSVYGVYIGEIEQLCSFLFLFFIIIIIYLGLCLLCKFYFSINHIKIRINIPFISLSIKVGYSNFRISIYCISLSFLIWIDYVNH